MPRPLSSTTISKILPFAAGLTIDLQRTILVPVFNALSMRLVNICSRESRSVTIGMRQVQFRPAVGRIDEMLQAGQAAVSIGLKINAFRLQLRAGRRARFSGWR